jgi:hypothetical protein
VAVTRCVPLACGVVDGRRSYPEEPGVPDPAPRWYAEDRGYSFPQQTSYGADPLTGTNPSGEWGYNDLPPVAPPPAPPVVPPVPPAPPPVSPPPGVTSTGEMSFEEMSRRHAEAIDRTQLRRTVEPPAAPPEPSRPAGTTFGSSAAGGAPGGGLGAVYGGKKPALAALLVVLTVLFELPVLRIFISAAFASHADAPGTISSIFMILGLPMFALGLYGLIGGAAAAGPGARTWLRVPLAYLPVGLVLFMAAALV